MKTRYPSNNDAVAAIFAAGTDVDCGSFMKQNVMNAINNGSIAVADLDARLLSQFRVRLRLGHFDAPSAVSTIGAKDLCTADAQELARDGVRQSVVLAKNLGATLPLGPAGGFQRAVVIGPNAVLNDTIRYYGSAPCNGTMWRPIDAVQQHLPAAQAILGVPSVSSPDLSGVAAAAAAAAAADLVILTIGMDRSVETEGRDRTNISFSDAQLALIAAVSAAAPAGVPVVAMVFSGGAMDVSPLLSNPRIGAVLVCGQPSVQVVGAVDVLFGRTLDGRAVAPAGRMSQMTYPADYVNQVSILDFGMRPGASPFPPGTNPGRTYRFFTGTPVLPYAFGLSYTTWQYTPVPGPAPPVAAAAAGAAGAATTAADAFGGAISLARVRAAAEAHARGGVVGHVPRGLKDVAADFYVNVTNTGAVDSDDVVVGFLVPPGAGQGGVALQELFGFERVFVPAGQTVTVYLGAQGVRFTQTGADGVRRFLPGEYGVRFGVRETAAHGMGFAERTLLVE